MLATSSCQPFLIIHLYRSGLLEVRRSEHLASHLVPKYTGNCQLACLVRVCACVCVCVCVLCLCKRVCVFVCCVCTYASMHVLCVPTPYTVLVRKISQIVMNVCSCLYGTIKFRCIIQGWLFKVDFVIDMYVVFHLGAVWCTK